MKNQNFSANTLAAGFLTFAAFNCTAEESSSAVQALSPTVISGYVEASAHWNPTDDVAWFPFSFNKTDGFNLNSVLLSLEKPLEEGGWSAGYRVDLPFGPDAGVIEWFGHMRQAYVAVRAPVGNGIDFKLGRWDTILGYESADSYKNPNYTRSFGFGTQPVQHDGVLATYQAMDNLRVNVGVANTLNTYWPNARSPRAESHKAYMASLALTVPGDFPGAGGSTLYAGVADGFGSFDEDQTSYYVGATILTPMPALRFGAALDYAQDYGRYLLFLNVDGADAWTVALYGSLKATEKLSFHVRGEYLEVDIDDPVFDFVGSERYAITGTIQYDLWQNVLSRLEIRWDQVNPGYTSTFDALLVATNLVYRF